MEMFWVVQKAWYNDPVYAFFSDITLCLIVTIGLEMANVIIKKQVILRTNSPLYPTGNSTSTTQLQKLQWRLKNFKIDQL